MREALEQIDELLGACLNNEDPSDWDEYFYLLLEIGDIVNKALSREVP